MNTIIASSIIAADWGRFQEEVEAVTASGSDWLHVDVMDGHFVPPITFGPDLVAAIKKRTSLPLDVHLMIQHPEHQLQAFRDAGADILTVHLEACPHLNRIVQSIHQHDLKAGVALNPATPVMLLQDVISDIDLVLIMTVNPGWGGQKFLSGSQKKIREASQLIQQSNRQIYLEVDGGVNAQTAQIAVGAGANVLVAGNSIFRQGDYTQAIRLLKTSSDSS